MIAISLGASQDWVESASCRGLNDVMYPDTDKAALETARLICSGCPVQRSCFWDAVRTDDMRHGIRAGLQPHERRDVLKELRKRGQLAKARKVAECGTRSGYSKHLRQKTKPCQPCRDANTAAWRQRRLTGTTRAAA